MSRFNFRPALWAGALVIAAATLPVSARAQDIPAGIVSLSATPNVVMEGNILTIRVAITRGATAAGPPRNLNAPRPAPRRGPVTLDLYVSSCFDLGGLPAAPLPDANEGWNPDVRTITVPTGSNEATVTLRARNGCIPRGTPSRTVEIRVWLAGVLSPSTFQCPVTLAPSLGGAYPKCRRTTVSVVPPFS